MTSGMDYELCCSAKDFAAEFYCLRAVNSLTCWIGIWLHGVITGWSDDDQCMTCERSKWTEDKPDSSV